MNRKKPATGREGRGRGREKLLLQQEVSLQASAGDISRLTEHCMEGDEAVVIQTCSYFIRVSHPSQTP